MARKESAILSDEQMDAMSENTGKALRKSDKVRIKIPIDPLNKSDKVVTVCINGHQYRINRGEAVEVPAVVAEVLEQSEYI